MITATKGNFNASGTLNEIISEYTVVSIGLFQILMKKGMSRDESEALLNTLIDLAKDDLDKSDLEDDNFMDDLSETFGNM